MIENGPSTDVEFSAMARLTEKIPDHADKIIAGITDSVSELMGFKGPRQLKVIAVGTKYGTFGDFDGKLEDVIVEPEDGVALIEEEEDEIIDLEDISEEKITKPFFKARVVTKVHVSPGRPLTDTKLFEEWLAHQYFAAEEEHNIDLALLTSVTREIFTSK